MRCIPDNKESKILSSVQFGIERELRHKFIYLLPYCGYLLFIVGVTNHLIHTIGNKGHMRFGKSAGGDGRGTDTDTRGDKSTLVVKGHHVLIQRDVGLYQGLLGLLA